MLTCIPKDSLEAVNKFYIDIVSDCRAVDYLATEMFGEHKMSPIGYAKY